MSTDGANQGTRWLPRLMGVLLLLMGLALLAGGIKLSQLGGSLYYLIAGIGFALSGALLLAKRRIALGLYGLVLLGSTVWAMLEVGLDWWQLVPRLAIWFAIGVVLLLPWARRPLTGPAAKANTALLSVAVLAFGRLCPGQPVYPPG
jgi:quinoprotein glucose dehydrogenase (EC 1.1.5.2)